MLTQKYLQEIQQKKNALKFSIERQRAAIEAFDQRTSNDSELGNDEYTQYNVYTDELAKMKKQLEELRLEADSFQLTRHDDGQKVILEISERGEMAFVRASPTEEPVIPPSMTSYAICRIEITENGYEIRYAERIRYIDELKLITLKELATPNNNERPTLSRASTLRAMRHTLSTRFSALNPPTTPTPNPNPTPAPLSSQSTPSFTGLKRSTSETIGPGYAQQPALAPYSAPNSPAGSRPLSLPPQKLNNPNTYPPAVVPTPVPASVPGIKLEWKDGTSNLFIMADEGNTAELMEVVGCHLTRYKRAKVKHVNRLKEIFKLKSTLYDSSNESHEEMLMNLWNLTNPNRKLSARKSSDWKELGFQGIDPATDFRGMGLLGLHCLIYFAARYPEKVAAILEKKRDYPFAVTGINITNMLLELMNIQKAGASKEGPTSSLWDTPLLVFFCMAEEHTKEHSSNNHNNGSNNNFTTITTHTAKTTHSNVYPFEEVYCMCFEVFDGIWAMMDAKYMDFPNVMARVKQLVTRVSEGRPTGWEDFRNRVQQLVISTAIDTAPQQPPPTTA